jgi:hypothetical protein
MFSAESTPREDTMEHSPATTSERDARTNWLVAELGRLAQRADDPQEQARYRRTADSLVRLAIALRP